MIMYTDGHPKLIHGCTRCGRCCMGRRGEEGIFLTPWDVLNIAKYYKISTDEVVLKYCIPIGYVEYILKAEGLLGRCVFLRDNPNGTTRCAIYAERPMACYLFPLGITDVEGEFVEHWDEFAKVKGVKPIDVNEFVQKSSRGRYSRNFRATAQFIWIIKTFLEKDRTLYECEQFRRHLFVNKNVAELNAKVAELLAKK